MWGSRSEPSEGSPTAASRSLIRRRYLTIHVARFDRLMAEAEGSAGQWTREPGTLGSIAPSASSTRPGTPVWDVMLRGERLQAGGVRKVQDKSKAGVIQIGSSRCLDG